MPYQGTGPAMTDLLGGQVDFMCDQTTNTTKQIQAGTVKAYAVTSPERLEVLPDVPTAIESGLDGFEVMIWHGLYAPAGTPQDVVDRLSARASPSSAPRPRPPRMRRRPRSRPRSNPRSPAGSR